MLSRTIQIKNGNIYQLYNIYKCDHCGIELEEAFPKWIDGQIHYCLDCSFKKNLITDRYYLDLHGVMLDNFHAAVSLKGNIIVWNGVNIPPLDRKHRHRNDPRHQKWRSAILKRDNYTCQKCFIRGGKLQAHHIKPYAKYIKLRYVLSNGICLCENCHKQEHKKEVK